MKRNCILITLLVVLFLPLSLSQNLPANEAVAQLSNPQSEIKNPKLDKAEFAQKTQKLQMPFIANEGQVDECVAFYAKTFGGTVFVTKNGDIVYSLPKSEKAEDSSHNLYRGETSRSCRDAIPCVFNAFAQRDALCRISEKREPRITDYVSWIVGCASYAHQTGLSSLNSPNTSTPTSHSTAVALKEEFVGAKISGIKGEGESVTKVSYFKGNNPSKWKSNISTYELVNVGEVYKGIELKLKAHGNNVEKLLYVKPGANPEQIKIRLSGIQPSESSMTEEIQPPESPFIKGDLTKSPLEKGARGLWVNEEGQLVAETELGPVKFTKPIAYQEIDGKRVDVPVEYRIQDVGWVKRSALNKNGLNDLNQLNGLDGFASLNPSYPNSLNQSNQLNISPSANPNSEIENPKSEYGFKVASYDRAKDLIIDPLLASTFLGGANNDYGYSLALDTSGNVYVTGKAGSGFPTTSGAYDTSLTGYNDVFVSKLDGGLTSLLASTFLGGSGNDSGYSLTLDTSGNVYVTGDTWSTDFPTTSGAYDTSFNGGLNDVFVSKLDSGLTSLLASTFLGGSGSSVFLYEEGYSLTLDTSGNVYVTGSTNSKDFLTTSGAYDTSYNGGYDVFISKLDSGLTSLLASTFLGEGAGSSLALDTSGNVYVTGSTSSSDFPTTSGAYDTSYGGSGDVFVSKLDGGLTSLLASTYLGGNAPDSGNSLALDTSGNVYVTGTTYSTDFPTTSGAYYDTSLDDSWGDAFVSKLDSGLTSLLASTYLGGNASDDGNFLALDTSGNVYVTGWTGSSDFPTTSGAYDTSFNGGGFGDAFVSKLNSGLTSLLASTYLGGAEDNNDEDEYGTSIALDTSGNVYVTGLTSSSDFPTTSGAYDTSFNGGDYDVFVSKLDSDLSSCGVATAITSSPSEFTIPWGDNTEVTVTVTGEDGCAVIGDKVKATSNNTHIATVSPSKVTTNANGQATFTIAGNAKGSAKVKFRESTANLRTKVNVEVAE